MRNLVKPGVIGGKATSSMSSELQDKSEIDAGHLPANKVIPRTDKLVGRFEVKPRDQSRMRLGRFTGANPPIGFSVNLVPYPDPPGSVVTEITSIGTPEDYEFVLHVANYGSQTVRAEVYEIGKARIVCDVGENH